jgi:hypothetical protein
MTKTNGKMTRLIKRQGVYGNEESDPKREKIRREVVDWVQIAIISRLGSVSNRWRHEHQSANSLGTKEAGMGC